MIKKLFLSIGLAFGVLSANAQTPTDLYLNGSLTTPGGAVAANSTTNVFLLSTNRANVHTILLSSTATGVATFYDSDNTNAPFFGINYTNNTYWTTASYPTNYVTTYISGLTGTTNVFTNQGTFTYFVTNTANTNALNAAYGAAWGANIAFSANNLNLTFARGITIKTSTNVNYVIGYTP